jgi:DNA-binding response OmpR family regulator
MNAARKLLIPAKKSASWSGTIMKIEPQQAGFDYLTFEVRRLKAGESYAGETHIPIVAMTAHALKGDQERCISGGMDGYVSKPIRTGKLFSMIEGLLVGRGAIATSDLAAISDPIVIRTD